jgi:hypothetical protein
MRTRVLPPEVVRLLGIQLNEGGERGWIDPLAVLLDVPPSTVKSWATVATSRAHRPISGPAGNLLMLYVVLKEANALPASLRALEAKYRQVMKGAA